MRKSEAGAHSYLEPFGSGIPGWLSHLRLPFIISIKEVQGSNLYLRTIRRLPATTILPAYLPSSIFISLIIWLIYICLAYFKITHCATATTTVATTTTIPRRTTNGLIFICFSLAPAVLLQNLQLTGSFDLCITHSGFWILESIVNEAISRRKREWRLITVHRFIDIERTFLTRTKN